jgi:predicted acylesterase/phospholipase RssA
MDPKNRILWKPRRLVLSGGGIRVVAHIGALFVLEREGFLQEIREYVGVSAGAFLASAKCFGYNLGEIKMMCSLFDFGLIRNLEPEAALEFPMTFGLDNGKNLKKLLETLLKLKGLPETLTFLEMKTRLPDSPLLRCYATDICNCEVVEFSAAKTPDCSVVVALMASMCLPGYFIPVRHPTTGHLMVDGGVLHNFPLAFLNEEERKDSIGLTFSYNHTRVEEVNDLGEFIQQIFACYYIPRSRALLKAHPFQTIVIPCGEYPAWHFEAEQEERERLMEIGTKAAEDFFLFLQSSLQTHKPIRRWSVS